MTEPNPWGLTDVEERILRSLVEHGCDKLVARQLGVNLKWVENRMPRIRSRMQVTSRVHMVVHFDRWDRARTKP